MQCPTCSQDNRDEARFCRACGTALASRCPACGAEAAPESAFCDRCGASLHAVPPAGARAPASYTPKHLADRILNTRSALEGERKHVTVLFADCAGFTAIAERIDPEEVHAIMDRCFDVVLADVHRFEGTVNQFTGDGVMALFGAPLALEDAPRRAVLAALEFQRSLEPLQAELAARGIDFRLRIGINTGLVVVGRIGNDLRMDYTAVGDTTNLAARLQALAAPGTVLVSETTHRLIRGFFATRPLPPVTVKGKREPVTAYEVLGEHTARGRIEIVAEAGLTPFVGRERELAALRDAFEAARDGRGQVVFLVGDAGLGKSRLLHEFRGGLAAEPHIWMEGRCASFGSTMAFLPVVDALRRFFAIEDDDDEARAADKVAQGIAALDGDLAWTLPFLRRLLALPSGDPAVEALDAVTRRSETFRALKAFKRQAAEQRPLIVLIEDLHWLDPASEEYLGYVADLVPAMRALLVCSHRPGYRHPFGDRSYHVRVPLQPLSEPEMGSMAGALLHASNVPDSLRALIARKADGNPLFVEEVTKSLVEEGVLRVEDDRIVLAREVADVAVPDTIQDVLMARLDRLADDPKRAIQIAAVIGREFALRLLARISEVGTRVPALVEELRALELIYEKAVHPELAYMFKHALTHDVAYESILVQRRKIMHRTIGLAIEELYAERLPEHYERLAHHFTRGEDWERALAYHERAAAKAMDGYANGSVVEHCRQALAVADRLGDAVSRERRYALEERLGLACLYLSRFRESGDAFVRAGDQAPDPGGRSIALSNAGNAYVWGHAHDVAERVMQESLALARAQGARAAEGLALAVEGFRVSVIDGRIPDYDRMTCDGLGILPADCDEGLRALIQSFQIEASEWGGDFARTTAIGEQVLAAGRRLRLAHLIVWPAWFMGKAACCLGDYRRALGMLTEAHDVTVRIGDRAWRTRLLNTVGWCYAEFGCHEEARRYNEQAATIARDVGDPEIICNAEINLGLNHLALGERGRALEHLETVRGIVAGPHDRFMRWRYAMHLQDALGQIALAEGAPDRALHQADEELAAARGHGALKLEARARLLRGRALVGVERLADADQALAETAALAARIGYRRAQWQALAQRAALARRAGRRADADALAAEAAALVDTLARSLPEPRLAQRLRAAAAAT